MRMLVSVRTVEEALVAADAGVDFIDLKEPRAGALGGLPVETIAAIVQALRAMRGRATDGPAAGSAEAARPGQQAPWSGPSDAPSADHGRVPSRAPSISATVGDLAMADLPAILRQVDAVGACGVDYVKVGIERRPGAADVLAALARSPFAVVPVFIADDGLDFDLVGGAIGFPAVMVDTADKLRGSLFDAMPVTDLRRFVERVRGAGRLAGLAGALRLADLPRLADVGPDFAGFRSAVCDGPRGSALSRDRLADLTRRMAGQLPA